MEPDDLQRNERLFLYILLLQVINDSLQRQNVQDTYIFCLYY